MSTANIPSTTIVITGQTQQFPNGPAGGGQVFVWNVGSNTWVPQLIFPTSIFSGAGGGGGGGGQVITSAPPIQLDLPDVIEADEKKADGATCKRCEEYNEFACPNQDDDTFLCYRCRHNL